MNPSQRPRSLVLATWWWGAAAVVVGAAAVGAWLGFELVSDVPRTIGWGIAAVLTALALVLGWGTLRLGLGHLAGRLTLTSFGIIAGLPALLKGGRLLPVALVLLIGVVLLYLPGTRAYFREQVRARRSAASAQRRAQRSSRSS